MKARSILFAAIILFAFSVTGMPQIIDEQILMTVNHREVPAGEFIRMYRKSPAGSEKTDIDDYLEQFAVFKLKVAGAIESGIDTTRAFRSELEGYRNQLAGSYLTCPGLKEELTRKMYLRLLTDIKASHLLVKCPPDAPPKDTLIAWNRAAALRNRILEGESFDKVAAESSDDRSAKRNGGNLGYFTAFQMAKSFEDAAFSLEPGIISMPVRTSFGYHLIIVAGRRPSKGRIKVAHIMKAVPENAGEKEIREAKAKTDSIYKLLEAGRPFGQLARLYSDHSVSSAKNGELNWFGTGEIIPDFAEAAFSISDTGKYIPPVRTPFGFHIIKLLEKKPPPSFEEAAPMIESRISAADLDALQQQSLVRRLKEEYRFTINQDVYKWFLKNTGPQIITGKSFYNPNSVPEGFIYTFAGQSMSAKDFAIELVKPGSIPPNNPKAFIDRALESAASRHIYEYEKSILEKKYPDFRYLMNEFHDGILLFEISSEKVWDRAGTDTAGLQCFYETNKHKHLSGTALEGKIYSLNMPGGMKKLTAAHKKLRDDPGIDEKMTERFNARGDTLLTISEGLWSRGDDPDIDGIEWKTGMQTFIRNKIPSLIFVKRIHEPSPLPFPAVQAELISEYQDYLMDDWVRQLKGRYSVEVNREVFEKVRKLLNDD